MPVNWSNPQEVAAFRNDVISQGANPTEADAYIASKIPTQTIQPTSEAKDPKSVTGFIKNVLGSGAQVGLDLGSAVVNTLNPDMEKNTVANLGKLAVGTGQLLIPGEQGLEDKPRAVGEFYKNRYGSLEAVGDTLYNDPVGALLDASVVLTGAGAIATKAGKLGKVSSLVKAGEAASKAGAAIDPLRLATKGVGKVVNPKLASASKKVGASVENLGKEVAVKALKPSPSQSAAFEEIAGVPLKDFIETNQLYGAGKTAAAKADDLIKPLQKEYNSLVRTGTKVSGAEYATALEQRALEILNKDHSAAARSVADGLWKEADTQRKIGDITDTILTNTKTSGYNKVPGNVMQDANAFNVNKEVANVGRNLLNEIAPGSAEVGQKLQALREFKDIATKQSHLGEGSNIIGALKPTGTAALAGAVIGGPVGAGVGLGLGLASQNPTVIRGVSNAARISGNAIKGAQIPTKSMNPAAKGLALSGRVSREEPTQDTSQVGDVSNEAYSPYDASQDGSTAEQQQITSSGQNNNQQQPGGNIHGDIVPQQQYLNPFGASPEQIYEAYLRTSQQGNKRKAAILKEMFTDEIKYQETQKNPKINSSGAAALSDSALALTTADDIENSIGEWSSIMGPIQGNVRKKNPYDIESQTFNAEITLAAQIIGKALEGGVLRAEDMPKYRAILPQITDTPATARNKIKQVKKLLQERYAQQEKFYRGASPDVAPAPIAEPSGGGNPGLNLKKPTHKIGLDLGSSSAHYLYR